MRHRKKGLKLGLPANRRKALLRGLASAIVTNGEIVITKTRAKALSSYIDSIFTTFRRQDEKNGIRFLKTIFYSKEQMKDFVIISEKMKERKSGFTSIVNLKKRDGDASQIAKIRFLF